jgi:methylated-DNA-[protein]-cysteine S-methyltransferase
MSFQMSFQMSFSVFFVDFGVFAFMGCVWSEAGLKRVFFPVETESLARQEIMARFPCAVENQFPEAWFKPLNEIFQGEGVFIGSRDSALDRYFTNSRVQSPRPTSRRQSLASLSIDFAELPSFHRRVYSQALEIPYGHCVSYSDLAKQLESPKAARAVGQAMSRNPLALLVPCHRVIASGGKIGGFTAPGGLALKSHLLARIGIVPFAAASVSNS